MEVFFKKISCRISSCLVTTALALIILSIVALLFDGTMICISTVFETFLVCAVIQVVLALLENWEHHNMIVEITFQYVLVALIVVGSGYLFHWIDYIPVWSLIIMSVVCYFINCFIEIGRIRLEINNINYLVKNDQVE